MMKFHHINNPVWLLFHFFTVVAVLENSNVLYANEPPETKGDPIIETFEIPAYRHKGEVWSFENAEKGQMWVGAEDLFLFDGQELSEIELPSEIYTVRALHYDGKGRLWIGSNTEIGHLEKDLNGNWVYISNIEDLRALGINHIRIWDIFMSKNGLVFIGDNHVIRLRDMGFESWEFESSMAIRSSSDGNNVWIIDRNQGIYEMHESGPSLLYDLDSLPENELISWLLKIENEVLLGTAKSVYKKHGNSWALLEPISSRIKNLAPWRVAYLGKDEIALGTSLGGVVIFNLEGEILQEINVATELPSDAITSIWFDSENKQLWMGFVEGISRYKVDSTSSIFRHSKETNTSPPFSITLFRDKIHFISKKSLQELTFDSIETHKFQLTEILQFPTPMAETYVNNDQFWLSSNGGGLYLKTDKDDSPDLVAPGFISKIVPSPSKMFELLYFDDGKLRAISPNEVDSNRVFLTDIDLKATPNSVVVTNGNEIWINTIETGVFCINYRELDGSPSFEIKHHFQPGEELPPNLGRVRLALLEDKLCLLSSRGVFLFNRSNAAFELSNLEGIHALPVTKPDSTTTPYWIIRNQLFDNPGMAEITYNEDSGKLNCQPIEVEGLDQIGKIYSATLIEGDNPTLWVAGQAAVLAFRPTEERKLSKPPKLHIKNVKINDNLHAEKLNGNRMIFSSNTKMIRFQIEGNKNLITDKYLIVYRILGFSNRWTTATSDSFLRFTGLKPQKYTLEFRAIDKFSQTGPTNLLNFRILSPWYLHPMAYAIYITLFLLMGYLLLRFREIHLNNLNRRLNHLVEERTIELARANTASNEFLEVISHEVRNPLNGIANLVDLLHDTKLDPEAQRLAGSLLRSTSQLKQVFGDILSFAKLEYGYVKIHQTAFSVLEMMEDLIAMYEFQAKEQFVRLSLIVEKDLNEWFIGDPEKIRTILKNFISNAIKYNPNGKVLVSVSSKSIDEGNQELTFSVKDDGPGIPDSEQKLIFNKFYRSERASNCSNVGTGLGLALCKTLSELIGGCIDLISSEQNGSEFILKVALQSSKKLDNHKLANPSIIVRLPPVKRALIVDDQEYNQEVLRGISLRLGYEPFIASNSNEVLLIANEHDFGVVFLDWELPGGLNGGEIALLLRQHPNTHQSVIIATTAHENDTIRQKCLEAGMDSFALKPFNSTKLKRILQEAWSRRRGGITEEKESQGSNNSVQTETSENEISLTAFSDYSFANPEQSNNAVDRYLDTLDEELESLHSAIRSKNAESIARVAHRLRSHSGLVNGTALNAASKELMLAARDEIEQSWQDCTASVFSEARLLKIKIVELSAQFDTLSAESIDTKTQDT